MRDKRAVCRAARGSLRHKLAPVLISAVQYSGEGLKLHVDSKEMFEDSKKWLVTA